MSLRPVRRPALPGRHRGRPAGADRPVHLVLPARRRLRRAGPAAPRSRSARCATARCALLQRRPPAAAAGARPGRCAGCWCEAWREPRRRMPAALAAPLRRRGRPPPRRHLAEAVNKEAGRRPSVAEYVELRRATSAAYVSYPLIEFVTGRPLPDAGLPPPAAARDRRHRQRPALLVQRPALAGAGPGHLRRAQPGAGARRPSGAVPVGGGGRPWWPSAGGRRCGASSSCAPARAVVRPGAGRGGRRPPRRGRRTPCAAPIDWTLESARYPAAPAARPASSGAAGRRRYGRIGSGAASGPSGPRPSRTTRSSRANTNSAMPTKPLAVKNARLTRDRSVGRDDRVLVDERDRGQRQPDPPEPAAARPARRTRRTARTSPRARRSTACSANGDAEPGRARLRTPISPVDLGVLAGVDQVEAADPQPDRRRRAPRPARSRRTCR